MTGVNGNTARTIGAGNVSVGAIDFAGTNDTLHFTASQALTIGSITFTDYGNNLTGGGVATTTLTGNIVNDGSNANNTIMSMAFDLTAGTHDIIAGGSREDVGELLMGGWSLPTALFYGSGKLAISARACEVGFLFPDYSKVSITLESGTLRADKSQGNDTLAGARSRWTAAQSSGTDPLFDPTTRQGPAASRPVFVVPARVGREAEPQDGEDRVTFVSVTQAFSTATSMGRLALNVLLSFAQFERELIAERTRDKIAAARRKGLRHRRAS